MSMRAYVVDMETIDEFTVKLMLEEPNGDFIYNAAVGTMSWQVSPTAYSEGQEAFAAHPVGTGPFMFDSYEPQSEIRYVANENYWKGAPLLDGLNIRIQSDDTVRTIELEAGSVHYIDNFVGDDALRLLEVPGLVVNAPVSVGNTFVSLNVSRYPMTELAVRRAVAYAMDWDSIIAELKGGFPVKALAGAGPDSPYFSEDVPDAPVYDPEMAGNILDEAGWVLADDGFRYRDGEKLVLNIISTDFSDWGIHNEVYQQALTEIGIDTTIKTAEWNAMLDEWRENQGNWHLGHHNQGSFFAVTQPIEASWRPNDFWTIYQIDDATEPYLVEVADELQSLADEFARTVDLETRKELANRVQTIFLEQQLAAWGYHDAWFNAHSDQVKGIYWEMGNRIPIFDKAWIEA